MRKICGAEGIVLHNGNVVLGMQKEKRWYNLENNSKGVIIKTIGGEIESVDSNSSKSTLIREITEEINGITLDNLKVSENPIFTKHIIMGDLNPYQRDSKLSMTADFYLVEIINKDKILPNDLPALIEIPISEFLNMPFSESRKLDELNNFIIRNDNIYYNIPDEYAYLIPEEVKEFLKK